MVLMRKGDVTEYVPDVFVEAYRNDGYTVDGESVEEVSNVETPEDAEESAEEKFVCPHCGKEYKTEANLVKHIAEKHAD